MFWNTFTGTVIGLGIAGIAFYVTGQHNAVRHDAAHIEE
jgi:hypothetical protein